MARDNRLLSAIRALNYGQGMTMNFSDALKMALEAKGVPLKRLANQAGVSYEQMKKVKQGKSGSTNVDDAAKIAAALGLTLDSFLAGDYQDRPSIAVAGKVGAGAEVDLVDAYPKGEGLYSVACPQGLSPHGIVAVEVEGTSMAPTYEPGAVLFYSRDTMGVPTEAIGRICVCEDDTGKAWVKQIKIGSEEGTFSLISVNPEAENMHGIRLRWAAPVRLHLPREFVKKV